MRKLINASANAASASDSTLSACLTPLCVSLSGSRNSYAWYLNVAQTFTEPNGGRLQAASLWLRNDSARPPITYELRVNTVDPATGLPQRGTTLALAELSSSQVSDTTLGWVRFPFPNPPQLAAGTQYALVLRMLGGTSLDDGYRLELLNSNPCPGGHFFVANPDQPFNPRPETDIAYQTEVSA